MRSIRTISLSNLQINDEVSHLYAFGAKIAPEDEASLVPGATYNVLPLNTSLLYRWRLTPETRLIVSKD